MIKTIQIFQTDGFDATLDAAKELFIQRNPGAVIVGAKFSYAYPGERNAEGIKGRWVGIDVEVAS